MSRSREADIRQILADALDADASAITRDTRLAEDLDIDELDVVDLVMSLECRFGVLVCADEADACRTVGDVIDLVIRLLDHQEAA